ncbi:MAG TPA: hypothetical protein VKD71_02560 [Gemmataceae bacterium]|nr:hypothetical protein [Gemmataceae bacterium]
MATSMPRKNTAYLFLLFVLVFAVGCSKSPAGKYHIEQDGYGFGPGADKIILDLRPDGSFDVKAGPVVLLDGTWQHKSGQISFSKDQGAIVVNYRIEGTALMPTKDGKDIPGWRWRR